MLSRITCSTVFFLYVLSMLTRTGAMAQDLCPLCSQPLVRGMCSNETCSYMISLMAERMVRQDMGLSLTRFDSFISSGDSDALMSSLSGSSIESPSPVTKFKISLQSASQEFYQGMSSPAQKKLIENVKQTCRSFSARQMPCQQDNLVLAWHNSVFTQATQFNADISQSLMSETFLITHGPQVGLGESLVQNTDPAEAVIETVDQHLHSGSNVLVMMHFSHLTLSGAPRLSDGATCSELASPVTLVLSLVHIENEEGGSVGIQVAQSLMGLYNLNIDSVKQFLLKLLKLGNLKNIAAIRISNIPNGDYQR